MILIDTSSWTQALRTKGDAAIRGRVRHWLTSGEAAWCEMVRLELWNGARGTEEQNRLKDFDAVLPRLAMDEEVWDQACEIAIMSRAAGLTVPNPDIAIFACARHHQVSLEHSDKHFTKLQSLIA